MKQNICPYAGLCGGCIHISMPYEAYLLKKKNFVLSSFSHEGIQIELADFIQIPFGTRRRATFAFKKGVLGFNASKSHQIISLNQCPSLTETLSNIISPLQNLIQKIKGSGDIFVTDTPFGVDMHIKSQKKDLSIDNKMELALFAQQNFIARLYYNFEPIALNTQLPYPIEYFMQPSVEGEQALINLVCSAFDHENKIIDLFCGMGTFTTPLLQKGFNVTGYDVAKESVQLLKTNGIQRDLFRNPVSSFEFDKVDGVVIDPPRAGAKAQIEELSKTNIHKIVMVSCNPITAARDSKILLENGWVLKSITAVDQFIYSNHIEVVCLFEK